MMQVVSTEWMTLWTLWLMIREEDPLAIGPETYGETITTNPFHMCRE